MRESRVAVRLIVRDGARSGRLCVEFPPVLWDAERHGDLASLALSEWSPGDGGIVLESDVDCDWLGSSGVRGAGKTTVAAGRYLVLLDAGDDEDEVHARLIDSRQLRMQQRAATDAPGMQGGLRIALAASTQQAHAKQLDVALLADDARPGRVTLQIRFGPHLISRPADLLLRVPRRPLADVGMRIPEPCRAILAAATELEVVSLLPYREVQRKPKPDTQPAPPVARLHGWRILGSSKVVDPDVARALVGVVFDGVAAWNERGAAGCFSPRHALRARRGSDVVEAFAACENCQGSAREK